MERPGILDLSLIELVREMKRTIKQWPLKQAFHLLVSISCFAFTLYQSYACFLKYLSMPKGTSLSFKPADKVGPNAFPAITICSERASKDTVFDSAKLEECNINRWKGYAEEGEWVPTDMNGDIFGDNENCTDPQKLFEYVVAQPSDLLYGLKYSYSRQSNNTKVYPNLENGILSKSDHEQYGRCFTATPTLEMVNNGIKQVDIYVKAKNIRTRGPKILVHNPGEFVVETTGSPVFIYTNALSQSQYQSEYELHNRVEDGEEPCIEDKFYSYDDCVQNEIEYQTISKYGCTTPFGPNKSNICTNITIGKQAHAIFNKLWSNLIQLHCKKPCRLLYTRLDKIKDSMYATSKPKGKVTLVMKDTVRTTNEIYLYSGLSLVAEVGGYVGLFLGVSVNQIADLIDLFLENIP